VPVRYPLVLVAALLLQLAAHPARDFFGDGAEVTSLLVASYVLLVAGFAFNGRYWFARILVVAALLNALAMGFNGWRMPVAPESLVRIGVAETIEAALALEPPSPKSRVLESGSTRLSPITDSVVVSWPSPNAVSPGDVLAMAGMLIAVPELWRLKSRSRVPSQVAAKGHADL